MSKNPNIALREIFHFIFLEHLLRASDPKLFTLKGGVNLRFFFNSPRYSEDMDIDVQSIQVSTLKKNCYKIIGDRGFRRSLSTYGISDLVVNDPTKAKQTNTTQRFKVRLVTSEGIELPTKVEFSRRESNLETSIGIVSPEIAKNYLKLSFKCQHYTGLSAAIQKVKALALRTETQARDVFDLYILFLGGHWEHTSIKKLAIELKNKAILNLESINYEQFRDQVEEYLTPEEQIKHSGKDEWQNISRLILDNLK